MDKNKVWTASYGQEPFDLRLTLLRLLKKLPLLLLGAVLGTVLLSGCYFLKKIVLAPAPQYEVKTVYKVEYKTPPVSPGDYYINDMTWNTYVQSDEFLALMQEQAGMAQLTAQELAESVTMAIASDILVPSSLVRTKEADKSLAIAQALQQVITGAFAQKQPEIASVRVIDSGEAQEVQADVRLARAVALSAVVSVFCVTVLFLLKELSDDSIYLPATLRSRYGLHCAGTCQAKELIVWLEQLTEGKQEIALCCPAGQEQAQECVRLLQQRIAADQESTQQLKEAAWTAVGDPIGDRAQTKLLQNAGNVLLAVPAGAHSGKRLEYLLAYLGELGIEVTGAVLWNADETLIRWYYRLGGSRDLV